MDEVKQLLELLMKTPEMALWALALYFLWTLLKIASWVGAVTILAKLFINKYFNYQESKLDYEKGKFNETSKLEGRKIDVEHRKLDMSAANRISEYFESKKILTVNSDAIIRLLDTVRNKNKYIHESNIEDAIEKLSK